MSLIQSSNALADQWLTWSQEERRGCGKWGLKWVEQALGESPTPGSTIVVGARTNVGKGMFSLELLRGMAESGPVVYLSLEDPPLEVGRRMSAAGYAHPNLYTAFPDPATVLRTFDEVLQSTLHPIAVGLDYIQCMGFDVETLTNAMSGIRERTRAAGAVSVVASQVNRPAPGETDIGVPGPHRLKGAGAIEERADIIFMLGNGKNRTLCVEVAKAKGCPVGARMRYQRGPGGRLIEAKATMDVADESED